MVILVAVRAQALFVGRQDVGCIRLCHQHNVTCSYVLVCQQVAASAATVACSMSVEVLATCICSWLAGDRARINSCNHTCRMMRLKRTATG